MVPNYNNVWVDVSNAVLIICLLFFGIFSQKPETINWGESGVT